jgi:hypothetical protein
VLQELPSVGLHGLWELAFSDDLTCLKPARAVLLRDECRNIIATSFLQAKFSTTIPRVQ